MTPDRRGPAGVRFTTRRRVGLKPDQRALLGLLRRWPDEAAKAGRRISRLAVAFEAGRDGFWLARWLRARGIEAYVIHATSIAVSRAELLTRAFIGWLRGEPNHYSMVPNPSLEEEDANRPNRERESLVGELLGHQSEPGAVISRSHAGS